MIKTLKNYGARAWNYSKRVAGKAVAAGCAAIAAVGVNVPIPAWAVDPVYTSQVKDALGAVNMTSLTTDVGAFGGMGFQLLLVTTGIFFAAAILKRFLKA